MPPLHDENVSFATAYTYTRDLCLAPPLKVENDKQNSERHLLLPRGVASDCTAESTAGEDSTNIRGVKRDRTIALPAREDGNCCVNFSPMSPVAKRASTVTTTEEESRPMAGHVYYGVLNDLHKTDEQQKKLRKESSLCLFGGNLFEPDGIWDDLDEDDDDDEDNDDNTSADKWEDQSCR